MRMIPALQPIINVETGTISAYEALVRWFDSGQLKNPSDVSHCWVQTDIDMLGNLLEYSEPMRKMSQRLFLNVSNETLASDAAYGAWRCRLLELLWGVSYPLTIEVVETVCDETLAKRWPDLRNLGVALALDDYGESYSQLARLMGYGWDYCKFDARTLDPDKSAYATKYCSGQSILMIAEKVENTQLGANARQCGVFEHQGFHYYQPEIITEFFEIQVPAC